MVSCVHFSDRQFRFPAATPLEKLNKIIRKCIHIRRILISIEINCSSAHFYPHQYFQNLLSFPPPARLAG